MIALAAAPTEATEAQRPHRTEPELISELQRIVSGTIHEVLKTWNKAWWRDQVLSLKQLHTVYLQLWSAEGQESVEWVLGKEEQYSKFEVAGVLEFGAHVSR